MDFKEKSRIFSIYDREGALFSLFFSFFKDFFLRKGEIGKPEMWVLEKPQIEKALLSINFREDIYSADNLFDLQGFLFEGPSSSQCNVFSRIREIQTIRQRYQKVSVGKGIILFISPEQIDDDSVAESFLEEWNDEDTLVSIFRFWS